MIISIRSIILQLLAAGLAGILHVQTLVDLGPTAPSPGTNDIYQLSTQGNQTGPDELNYYTDNQTGHGTAIHGSRIRDGHRVASKRPSPDIS